MWGIFKCDYHVLKEGGGANALKNATERMTIEDANKFKLNLVEAQKKDEYFQNMVIALKNAPHLMALPGPKSLFH